MHCCSPKPRLHGSLLAMMANKRITGYILDILSQCSFFTKDFLEKWFWYLLVKVVGYRDLEVSEKLKLYVMEFDIYNDTKRIVLLVS